MTKSGNKRSEGHIYVIRVVVRQALFISVNQFNSIFSFIAQWIGRDQLGGFSAPLVSGGFLSFLSVHPTGTWAGLEGSGSPLSHTYGLSADCEL